tara:strand:+ start:304 stop:660 length:357 start_codon:yes stop_codon:yes gene_type:complete
VSDSPDPDDPAARLKALEEKLASRRTTAQVDAPKDGHYQGQLAWRMVIELVAGLGIGFGIGYSLDRFFGTLPIFLVIFVLFGLAAGIKTMLRSAEEVQKKQLAGQAGPTAKNEGETRG